MKTPCAEEFDLIITHYLERYLEMSSEEACVAIEQEWHEQIAALITDYLFRDRCINCRGLCGFVQVKRTKGKGDHDSTYIVPFCEN